MESNEIKNESMSIEECDEQKQKKKFNLKKLFIGLGIFIGLMYALYIYILSRPLVTEDLSCNYNNKFNKITCIQTGDVVPQWLQIDDNQFSKILGVSNPYSMKLIIFHNSKNYRVLNMVDKEFIADMNRKFIYELKEQTFIDWINFKKYSYGAKTSNWGSVILYCSENNLNENVCKQIKKQYKK